MKKNPIIVLVETQLPENLGAVARVMANFGMHDLRVVNPVCNIDDPKSLATATEGAFVLKQAQKFSSLEGAIADCHLVVGTTCSARDMVKIYKNPRLFFEQVEQFLDQKIALVFGPERTGLSNEQIVLCHQLISIPTRIECASMNLSHAVAIVAHEFSATLNDGCGSGIHTGSSPLATFNELDNFLNILEKQLDQISYWRVPSKKKKMWQNLRNIFTRCHLTHQETKTLIGLIDMLKNHKDD